MRKPMNRMMTVSHGCRIITIKNTVEVRHAPIRHGIMYLGMTRSSIDMSFESLVMIRPIGFESKKRIGALAIF